MKVLMAEQFLPQNTYTLELCKALRHHAELTIFCKKGAEVSLEGVRWKPCFYEGGKNPGAAVLAYGKGLLKLAQEVNRAEYDVVHVQNFKDARHEIPIYCRVKPDKVLAHTVHNLLPHEAAPADRELYRRLYQRSDLLVVHNLHCRKLLMDEYQIEESKICVMPHGSYTQTQTSPARRWDTEQVHFLQFGALRKYKGVDILLEALALLPGQARQQIHVTIAGAQYPKLDGTDYEGMVQKLHLQDIVTLRRTHVPDAELDALYQDTDICLFPYREIYGSGALLMAYSYGKPVIASDIPVFQEETENGKAGLLFASEQPEQLKNAILQTLGWSGQTYQTCQQEIQTLVQEKYNWERSAKQLAEAYQKAWARKNK